MTPSVTLAEGVAGQYPEGGIAGSIPERGEQAVSRRKKTLF
jgi:hypothetical protein